MKQNKNKKETKETRVFHISGFGLTLSLSRNHKNSLLLLYYLYYHYYLEVLFLIERLLIIIARFCN